MHHDDANMSDNVDPSPAEDRTGTGLDQPAPGRKLCHSLTHSSPRIKHSIRCCRRRIPRIVVSQVPQCIEIWHRAAGCPSYRTLSAQHVFPCLLRAGVDCCALYFPRVRCSYRRCSNRCAITRTALASFSRHRDPSAYGPFLC